MSTTYVVNKFPSKISASWFLFLWAQHVSPIEIYCQFVNVNSHDGANRVQQVKKWLREFENGLADIHDNDRFGEPVKTRVHVKAAQERKLILETDNTKARFVLELKSWVEMLREFVYDRKWSVSTVKELVISY